MYILDLVKEKDCRLFFYVTKYIVILTNTQSCFFVSVTWVRSIKYRNSIVKDPCAEIIVGLF